MHIPQNFQMPTKDFVQVMTKFCLYLSKYGAKAMEEHLDTVPLRLAKVEGKNLGAFLVSKVLEEFQGGEEPLTRFNLFHSKNRNTELLDARMLTCVLASKFLGFDHSEIGGMFNKTRHFTKKALRDFQHLDPNLHHHKELIEKYNRIAKLILAYIDFVPKTIEP